MQSQKQSSGVKLFFDFINGFCREKICLRGFRQSETQQVSSATRTSQKIESLPKASLHMILATKRITKALIRLRGCAGWSALVLFTNPQRQVFSRQGQYYNMHHINFYKETSPKCIDQNDWTIKSFKNMVK